MPHHAGGRQGEHRERMARMEVRTESDIPDVLRRAQDLEAQIKIVEKTMHAMYTEHKVSQGTVAVNRDRIENMNTDLTGMRQGLDRMGTDLVTERERAASAIASTKEVLHAEYQHLEQSAIEAREHIRNETRDRREELSAQVRVFRVFRVFRVYMPGTTRAFA